MTTFKIVNTKNGIAGPFGEAVRYVHNAARPFAVLRINDRSEICVGRYSTEAKAKNAVRHAIRMRELGARNQIEDYGVLEAASDFQHTELENYVAEITKVRPCTS